MASHHPFENSPPRPLSRVTNWRISSRTIWRMWLSLPFITASFITAWDIDASFTKTFPAKDVKSVTASLSGATATLSLPSESKTL
ncbi:hypothetical protein, partial [Xenorhabdus bovienii]|uniref:hypothetical protein n=1 Tax=Xenorhabdus bovienii TaxID=40576 RepID=UPI003DA38C56